MSPPYMTNGTMWGKVRWFHYLPVVLAARAGVFYHVV